MNTGLRGIFNGFSVEIFLKNDSSPQITNLARINTGIAEMLFGRVETPKGIETNVCRIYHVHDFMFGRVETPKGIETPPCVFTVSGTLFGRVETPKGIETNCAGVILLNIL